MKDGFIELHRILCGRRVTEDKRTPIFINMREILYVYPIPNETRGCNIRLTTDDEVWVNESYEEVKNKLVSYEKKSV